MKMTAIGALVLVVVLAVLYVATGGLKSDKASTEQEVNGEPAAVVVEPADAAPAGNKNFNL